MKLRFVDVELDTLNMDASKLEAALTPHTRMVVAVSILGNPAPLDRIRAFCDAHDLILGNNIPMLEEIVNVSSVNGKRVFLVALPIPVVGLDSCPVRPRRRRSTGAP